MRKIRGDKYPENWDEISEKVKRENGYKCERCNHTDQPKFGFALTTHHLDGDRANCQRWNLAALCQRCHLHIQNKVIMNQMFMFEIIEVSEWFKHHLEGYLKSVNEND
jgi:hypothetical protein